MTLFYAEFRPYSPERWDALGSSGELLVRAQNDSGGPLVVEAVEVTVLGWSTEYLDQVLVDHGWDRVSEWSQTDHVTARLTPADTQAPQRVVVEFDVAVGSPAAARWMVRQWLHDGTPTLPEGVRWRNVP